MVQAANLGYPRLGRKRELKRALERYWRDTSTEAELLEQTKALRLANWELQAAAGVDYIPSNDFSLYDQVLDTTALVGAVPPRYQWTGEYVDLRTYFAMARGAQNEGVDVPAMEMTKWFDTNYHYLVPEFAAGQHFRLGSTKVVDEFLEAKQAGIHTRPVLLGPLSYLLLGKSYADGFHPLALLPHLLPVYQDVLKRLADAGADWVQLDEPYLVLDLSHATRAAYTTAYHQLRRGTELELMLATYFGDLRDNLVVALELPVNGLHIDLVRAPGQLDEVLPQLPENMVLSLGVVNGRNVWRTNLDHALELITHTAEQLGADRVQVAPSCSLLFSPYDLDLETDLDDEVRSWLAFANQKISELVLLKRAANDGVATVATEFAASRAAIASRRTSERTHTPAVRHRTAAIPSALLQRRSKHATRKALQSKRLQLPYLPTTTIGSFPQTAEVRAQRAAFREQKITAEAYTAFLKAEIERTIRKQEAIGLDVLVHGEFERTDMVEYFGEQFTGVAFTHHGWVQSYGSRGVRPPIIYGDVARPEPMTVEWATYAQALTDRPMKGMLTGPVTIVQWSFVRDDQPHADTCQQIALAIRDEVLDLEKAGITIIQIDEPAIREGLPLRRADWDTYLRWAIDCFRLASSGVRDATQIHTHMCYAEFNDIIDAIGRMDADVISLEGARSKLEVLSAFTEYQYPNDIGPGIYDIHSPRVPAREEMEELLNKALRVLKPEQLWVNPDCGLKTRDWEEVEAALSNMVEAARALRAQVGDTGQTAS